MTSASETKGIKTMKRSATLFGLAIVASLAFASSAFGAASLQPSGGPAKVIFPGQERSGSIVLKNVGDAPLAANTATVTFTLPAELSVTSVSADGSRWNCVVAPGKDSVTCAGPTLGMPVGSSQCESFGFFFPCGITLGTRAAANASKGTVSTSIQACVTGAPPCTTISAPTVIQDFGDNFGFAPINVPGADAVPAIPGQSAFWAGSCDRASAPPFGDPIPAPGLGSIPSTVWAPRSEDTLPYRIQVPAPTTTAHCIDLGEPAIYPQAGSEYEPGLGVWFEEPDWRLPPAEQAGSHPDGSSAMALKRDAASNVDGSVDNIAVELPPGFVGDPNAIAKCSHEEFAGKPPQCSPASQVGVLHLLIQGRGLGHAGHGPGGNHKIYPVWNLEPRAGRAAEFGFAYASGEDAVNVRLSAKARTNGDYGVTAFTGQIPSALTPVVQTVTLWGVPWDASNDVWRAPKGMAFSAEASDPCADQPGAYGSYIPFSGFVLPGCAQSYDPSWGPIKPFFSQETDCAVDSTVVGYLDSYQNPGAFVSDGSPTDQKLGFLSGDPDPSDPDWKTATSAQAAVTGCEKLGFSPTITLDPTGQGGAAVQSADSPAGLDVELTIPQNNDLPFDQPASGAPQVEVDQYVADAMAYFRSEQGLATAHLKDTTATLAEGMTLNPAAASGQGACTMQQIGVTDTNFPVPPKIRFNNAPVQCPDTSKVGEVVVETPLLDEADWPTGNVYLAQQGANPFGSDFAIYIALESPERGLTVKLAGKVTPDPQTGRLTTTVTENPELPFDTFSLKFKGGPRAPLATPVTCGTHTSTNSFASHAQPNAPVTVNDPMQVTTSPAGGCATIPEQRPFSLGFSAGSTDIVAGAHSGFTARFTRGDGNQELDRIELTTPEGLAAKLAGVPYCPESGIRQATNRTASGDGALEQSNPSCPSSSKVGTTTIGAGAGSQPFFVSGDVYLAGPYKGAPVSLAFIVPAVAGPFDLGVQVVRTALNVDPKTAQVTAVSDTIPKILRGVPLRLRDVRVDIDRPGFIVNPTDCAEQKVSGKVFGASGASTEVSSRFQIAECARLGFKPSLTLKLKGGTKRAKYQGLSAVVVPRPGDANIAATSVTMPRSAFLAQEHIRTVCTRVQFAADACPAGSIYGNAKAWSPLLDEPLTGNVYLRSSSNKLPDLVADLRGPASQPIRVELSGRTDSFKRALRNTFDIVPDAPVTRFELELFGGQKGLIVNSQDLCRKKHFATVKMTAQNGREHNFRPVVKNGCKKIKPNKGKKKAKEGKKRQSKQAKGRTASTLSLASIARGLF